MAESTPNTEHDIPTRIVDVATRKHAAATTITCAVTGAILDYRTVVLVYGPSGKLQAAISPEGYRIRKEALEKHLPGVRFENAPTD